MSHAHDKPFVLPADQIHIPAGSMWRKMPIIGLLLGAASLGGAWATSAGDSHAFWYAYLVGYMVFLAFALGGLFFTIVQHLVRAGWSIAVRRIAENAMITLPVLCLLGLPIIFLGAHDLYHWTDVAAVEHDFMLNAKKAYLNEGFFRIRMFVYFGIWTVLSLFFYGKSTGSDGNPEAGLRAAHSMRFWAAPALLLFALSLSFAAFDLLMSLDPHWFSTMFGVYYFAGSALSEFALITLTVILLHKSGYLRGVVTTEHYHDLGKFLFGFTVFYTYIAFSQYFLIWYANIPEETMWFGYRIADDFLPLTFLLVVGRFFIPFFFLLRRGVKRNAFTLTLAAVWILFMQVVDMFWLIQPVRSHHHALESGDHVMHMHIGPVDILALLGVAGVFIAAFTWALGRKALVPTGDPRIEESVRFENF
ncbi:hypothetical protein [Nannocystis punicea]|uniref:Quinol:cytochrome c oxidoreductase quinone-binding subunit 2 n=1 Tax=Nannocystis punicea TaxID=2995304 RepID=A0ABY7GZ08_9BACT|nr:hypothetical protein [Nannocystis poenicansa]WAS92233.1 hypothetical protein O0S08_39130 [Nannocystis poenicansa]